MAAASLQASPYGVCAAGRFQDRRSSHDCLEWQSTWDLHTAAGSLRPGKPCAYPPMSNSMYHIIEELCRRFAAPLMVLQMQACTCRSIWQPWPASYHQCACTSAHGCMYESLLYSMPCTFLTSIVFRRTEVHQGIVKCRPLAMISDLESGVTAFLLKMPVPCSWCA